MDKRTATAMLLFLVAGIIATYVVPSWLKNKNHTVSQESIVQTIDSLIQMQSAAWNKNDLDGFMSVYQKSDSLLFISKNSTNLGWQKLYDIYKEKYFIDTLTRGLLQFELEKVSAISSNNKLQIAIGKWQVQRPNEILSGKFSLLFQQNEQDKWEIIIDHTW
jgi:ketosteroid isomerase-like protein